jgi:hypothetical protein
MPRLDLALEKAAQGAAKERQDKRSQAASEKAKESKPPSPSTLPSAENGNDTEPEAEADDRFEVDGDDNYDPALDEDVASPGDDDDDDDDLLGLEAEKAVGKSKGKSMSKGKQVERGFPDHGNFAAVSTRNS